MPIVGLSTLAWTLAWSWTCDHCDALLIPIHDSECGSCLHGTHIVLQAAIISLVCLLVLPLREHSTEVLDARFTASHSACLAGRTSDAHLISCLAECCGVSIVHGDRLSVIKSLLVNDLQLLEFCLQPQSVRIDGLSACLGSLAHQCMSGHPDSRCTHAGVHSYLKRWSSTQPETSRKAKNISMEWPCSSGSTTYCAVSTVLMIRPQRYAAASCVQASAQVK